MSTIKSWENWKTELVSSIIAVGIGVSIAILIINYANGLRIDNKVREVSAITQTYKTAGYIWYKSKIEYNVGYLTGTKEECEERALENKVLLDKKMIEFREIIRERKIK